MLTFSGTLLKLVVRDYSGARWEGMSCLSLSLSTLWSHVMPTLDPSLHLCLQTPIWINTRACVSRSSRRPATVMQERVWYTAMYLRRPAHLAAQAAHPVAGSVRDPHGMDHDLLGIRIEHDSAARPARDPIFLILICAASGLQYHVPPPEEGPPVVALLPLLPHEETCV